jgi:hypothetical protein
VVVVAGVFLLAHLASLPPTFDDIDSLNFALGVRDFDVARHQPHPPGYPIFIALAKVSTAVCQSVGSTAPEVHGLAVWSALGGCALVVGVFLLARLLFTDLLIAAVAMLVTAAAPLVWFTALRPLSDAAGLAAAFASIAAVMASSEPRGGEWSVRRTRLLLVGAVLGGLAGGFRSQMLILTMPLLGVVVVRAPARKGRAALRVAAVGAASIGVLGWAIPLVIASGGLERYLQALGSQAGEDFAGVEMLWTNPTPRTALLSLLNTFVLPWDAPFLAGVVTALAAAGFVIVAFSRPRRAALLAVVFGPYLLFHLLFQETVTTRYALPIVPAVALLVAIALGQARRGPAVLVAATIVVGSAAQAVPAGRAFGRSESPIFAAVSEMKVLAGQTESPVLGMHRRTWSESRRARPWADLAALRQFESPRDYEWLELTRAWREGHEGAIWFLGDPRRTDLALIDAEHRRTREYRWPFDQRVYVGGARPGELDWHIYQRPGWFLERGWALTPEIAGITERDGWGPHRRASLGWVRRRSEEAMMTIGGRHLGGSGEPAVGIAVALDGRTVTVIETGPGYFLRFVRLPAGVLTGEGRYAALTVTAAPVGPGPTPRVGLEQFNLQSSNVVQFGFDDGWYEPEFNPRDARSWRWMGERAALRVHHAGRDVAIAVRGESALRYYAEPPVLRARVGDAVVGELRPEADFTFRVRVPAAALSAAGGRVVLESTASFVPGDRGQSPDRRRLALRIYSVEVKAQSP